MIEGLLLLPFQQEAERREPRSKLLPCDECMQSQSVQIRQTMGCAYEAPAPENLRGCGGVRTPAGCSTVPTVCPGYTTRLPEVIEVARARLHWLKAGPTGIGITDWVNSPLIRGVEILEGTYNELHDWRLANPEKQ